MKTAEAWARRMKKVTDRTRAKICLSILPPPPPPPPFTFPRLPLPLPPPPPLLPTLQPFLPPPGYPFRLLPVRIPSYFSSSRFSLFPIFAPLPLPSPRHLNCLHRDAETVERNRSSDFPTTHRRKGITGHRIDSVLRSFAETRERERETKTSRRWTRLKKKRKGKEIEETTKRDRKRITSYPFPFSPSLCLSEKRNGAIVGKMDRSQTCDQRRDFPWKVCPAASRNHTWRGQVTVENVGKRPRTGITKSVVSRRLGRLPSNRHRAGRAHRGGSCNSQD